MKKALIFLAILFSTPLSMWAKEIVIKGIYQGVNLYVRNPFSSTGVGFCIYEVTVNGQVTTDEINSSAFEIDLSFYNLKKGAPVSIVIKHKDGCVPKILNEEVLKPKSSFVVTSIKLNKADNKLEWKTIEENGKIPFIVEQYRWKKWVKVAELEGVGVPKENSYNVKLLPHSGSNRFRVKQIDHTKKPRYSKEVKLQTMMKPISFNSKKVKDKLEFSEVTDFEIYNYYGSLVMKGREKIVNVSKLKKGDYFLNFDNKTETFKKK